MSRGRPRVCRRPPAVRIPASVRSAVRAQDVGPAGPEFEPGVLYLCLPTPRGSCGGCPPVPGAGCGVACALVRRRTDRPPLDTGIGRHHTAARHPPAELSTRLGPVVPSRGIAPRGMTEACDALQLPPPPPACPWRPPLLISGGPHRAPAPGQSDGGGSCCPVGGFPSWDPPGRGRSGMFFMRGRNGSGLAARRVRSGPVQRHLRVDLDLIWVELPSAPQRNGRGVLDLWVKPGSQSHSLRTGGHPGLGGPRGVRTPCRARRMEGAPASRQADGGCARDTHIIPATLRMDRDRAAPPVDRCGPRLHSRGTGRTAAGAGARARSPCPSRSSTGQAGASQWGSRLQPLARDAFEGGGGEPPLPPGRPAHAHPLTASANFHGICNRQ